MLHVFKRMLLVAALALVSHPASADPTFFDGNWRGVETSRGSGTGPYVGIVTMQVTRLPPRDVRDLVVRYSVSLRVSLSDGTVSLRQLPPPPLNQYPQGDRRPAFVPRKSPPIDLAGAGTYGNDPAEGEFVMVSVRPGGSECGFSVSVVPNGGPAGDRTYYQVIPQRARCSGGRFAGIAASRGFLER